MGVDYSTVSMGGNDYGKKLKSDKHFSLIIKRVENDLSIINRLFENAKFKKSGIDSKGLMTQEFAKISILGQPVKN